MIRCPPLLTKKPFAPLGCCCWSRMRTYLPKLLAIQFRTDWYFVQKNNLGQNPS